MDKVVAISNGDGWHWTYLNGELFSSGHEIPFADLLKKFGVDCRFDYITEKEAGEYGELADEAAAKKAAKHFT